MKKWILCPFSMILVLLFQNPVTIPVLSLSSSTFLYQNLKDAMSSWSHTATYRNTEHASDTGSCEFKMPQAEEASQFGFRLSLATEGKRKAAYKHHLLLQQFVNLAHLSHALFMSEWKTIGFVSDKISKCWKEWQILVFHFGHTNTQFMFTFTMSQNPLSFLRVIIKRMDKNKPFGPAGLHYLKQCHLRWWKYWKTKTATSFFLSDDFDSETSSVLTIFLMILISREMSPWSYREQPKQRIFYFACGLKSNYTLVKKGDYMVCKDFLQQRSEVNNYFRVLFSFLYPKKSSHK